MSRSNLEAIAALSTPADLVEALASWKRYHSLMLAIGQRLDFEVKVTAGVFAALSPNSEYVGNLRDTVRVLRSAKAGLAVDGFKVSTYGANKRKAWAIAHGVPALEALRANKTRNFYLNIVNPDDPEPITVDGHIFNCWSGTRLPLNDAGMKRFNRLYVTVADDVRAMARERGILGNQMQGLLWFCWKRIHRIKWTGQLELLPADELVANHY